MKVTIREVERMKIGTKFVLDGTTFIVTDVQVDMGFIMLVPLNGEHAGITRWPSEYFSYQQREIDVLN